MIAKPMKTLEFHYPMIQFLKKRYIRYRSTNQIAGNSLFSSQSIPKLNVTLPSQFLVSSDKRRFWNLTFHSVLARQGSSLCNGARLNFQAFALCRPANHW